MKGRPDVLTGGAFEKGGDGGLDGITPNRAYFAPLPVRLAAQSLQSLQLPEQKKAVQATQATSRRDKFHVHRLRYCHL